MSNRRPKGPRHAFHVLVVENDEQALAITEMVLKGEGADYTVARDVATGLAIFAATRPDAVVIGSTVGGVDCFDVIAQMRVHHVRRRPPAAVVLSSDLAPIDARKAAAAGFIGVLGRPLSIPAVAAAIRGLYRIVHRRALARAKLDSTT
ncbi:MAG TPA: response regulator [Polyangiaceae bacterium]